MRYKFTIEYDGSKFPLGWQAQENLQGSVQEALAIACKNLCQENIVFHGAGRTDSMVHATGQVAHADLPKSYSLRILQDGMNFYLNKDNFACRIKEVAPVKENFHSRFDAKEKQYEYLLYHGQTCSIFYENRVWWVRDKVKIDWNKVILASKELLGYHDFSSFRSSACQSDTFMRTINSIEITNINDLISFKFFGKSFLHKQIRIMVGTLIEIGSGKIKSTISEIISNGDRKYAGQTAPGYGLYLRSIKY